MTQHAVKENPINFPLVPELASFDVLCMVARGE